jgi:hypothetical protein
MKRTPHPLVVALCLSACNGGSLTDATTTTTDALLSQAQCTYQGFDAAAKACFDSFKTCLANAETNTPADCQAALKACLPAPPPRPTGGPDGGGMPGGCDGDGHGGPGGPGGHGGPGGPPPLLPDGGLPPPPPGAPPLPDPAALQACHDAANACIAAGTSQDSCASTEHDCIRAAFQAAFAAACQSDSTSEKCQQGVDGMPPDPDGGSQCSSSSSGS